MQVFVLRLLHAINRKVIFVISLFISHFDELTSAFLVGGKNYGTVNNLKDIIHVFVYKCFLCTIKNYEIHRRHTLF